MITRSKLIQMHKDGRLSTEELTRELEMADTEREMGEYWNNVVMPNRNSIRLNNFYLMLDPGWNHVYKKWSEEYKNRVKDFLSAVKPFLKGKTVAELEGFNPGNLCARGIDLYKGVGFVHFYPLWGDVLAVQIWEGYPWEKDSILL